MSSTFLPSHGDAHSQITPLLPHHSFYLMNIHQTAEGDVSLFFFFFTPAAAVVFLSAFLERWNFNDIADQESELQKPHTGAA